MVLIRKDCDVMMEAKQKKETKSHGVKERNKKA